MGNLILIAVAIILAAGSEGQTNTAIFLAAALIIAAMPNDKPLPSPPESP